MKTQAFLPTVSDISAIFICVNPGQRRMLEVRIIMCKILRREKIIQILIIEPGSKKEAKQ